MSYKILKSVFDRQDEFALKKLFNSQFTAKKLHGLHILMQFTFLHSVVSRNHNIINDKVTLWI